MWLMCCCLSLLIGPPQSRDWCIAVWAFWLAHLNHVIDVLLPEPSDWSTSITWLMRCYLSLLIGPPQSRDWCVAVWAILLDQDNHGAETLLSEPSYWWNIFMPRISRILLMQKKSKCYPRLANFLRKVKNKKRNIVLKMSHIITGFISRRQQLLFQNHNPFYAQNKSKISSFFLVPCNLLSQLRRFVGHQLKQKFMGISDYIEYS